MEIQVGELEGDATEECLQAPDRVLGELDSRRLAAVHTGLGQDEDYEWLPGTVVGLHFVAFACLFIHRAISMLGSSP